MPDYKSMYFKLAAKVADAVELLTDAQIEGEDAYIESEDTPVVSIVDEDKTEN